MSTDYRWYNLSRRDIKISKHYKLYDYSGEVNITFQKHLNYCYMSEILIYTLELSSKNMVRLSTVQINGKKEVKSNNVNKILY